MIGATCLGRWRCCWRWTKCWTKHQHRRRCGADGVADAGAVGGDDCVGAGEAVAVGDGGAAAAGVVADDDAHDDDCATPVTDATDVDADAGGFALPAKWRHCRSG